MTSPAERGSVAITVAPEACRHPGSSPPGRRRRSGTGRISSGTCMKRFSRSSRPRSRRRRGVSAMNWACMWSETRGTRWCSSPRAAGLRRGCGSSPRPPRSSPRPPRSSIAASTWSARAPRSSTSPPARRHRRCQPRSGRGWCGGRRRAAARPRSDPVPWPSMRAPRRRSASRPIGISGVLEHRRPRRGRRHQQVLGAGDGDHVGRDRAPSVAWRGRRCGRARP